MKKLTMCLLTLALLLFLLPFQVFAEGGYVASRNSNVYHVPDCHHVNDINANNLISWHTEKEVLATGRRPCSDCRPDKHGSDFEYGETYRWTSESPRTQIAFEQEYAGGYKEGYKEGYKDGETVGNTNGYKSGKSVGYNEGLKVGTQEGYSEGLDEGTEEGYNRAKAEFVQELTSERSDASADAYMLSAVIGLPLASVACASFFSKGKRKKQETYELEVQRLRRHIDKLKNDVAIAKAGISGILSEDIPPDISLAHIVVPVSGFATTNRPYGDYTIYTSPHGTKYHCRYGCGNATTSTHFFTRPSGLEPCKNCVPNHMYPQPLPAWYFPLIGQEPRSATRPIPAPVEPSSNVGSATPKVSQKPEIPARRDMIFTHKSSFLEAVCYKNGGLYIKLRTGGIYWYYNLPHVVYLQLMTADSMGRFYREHIMDKYPYIPV